MFAMQGPLFARLSATVSSWLAGRGGLAGDGGKRPQNVSRVTGGGRAARNPKGKRLVLSSAEDEELLYSSSGAASVGLTWDGYRGAAAFVERVHGGVHAATF